MIGRVLSPAKINCCLHVTRKREDGYHDIFSLMVCIGLYDEITLAEAEDIRVVCEHPDVPEDESNTAFRAARLFYDNLPPGRPHRKKGVSIKIEKHIPVGAGLGGGSSNAASVLRALNTLRGRPYSADRLMEMGLSVGSDVPFFLFRTPAIVRGVGDKITPCPNLRPYSVVLFYPGVAVSTGRVYKNTDLRLTQNSKIDINTFFKLCREAPQADVAPYVHNDLEAAAAGLYPGVMHAKVMMTSVLSRDVCMTGSGSSLFALYADHERAEKAYDKLSSAVKGKGEKVFLTSFKLNGEQGDL